MALPSSGITTTMVNNVLKIGSFDVGTLHASSNVNGWSKKKPVQWSSPAPDRVNDKWWMGNNGCCGFSLNSVYFNSASALVTAYQNGATYTREYPTSIHRLADFENYEHGAISPIWSFSIEGTVYTQEASKFTCTILDSSNLTTYNLRIQDIQPNQGVVGSDFYFGIILISPSGTYYYKTNANKASSAFSSTNNSVSVSNTEISEQRTWNVYPALFEMACPTLRTNAGSGNSFIAIPKTSGGDFHTSTTVSSSPYEGAIGWVDGTCIWSQAVNLTMQGQLAYLNTYEGTSGVTVTYTRKVYGTTTHTSSENITLTKESSSGNINKMTVSNMFKWVQEDGVEYFLTVKLGSSNYTVTAQCTEVEIIEPMSVSETEEE